MPLNFEIFFANEVKKSVVVINFVVSVWYNEIYLNYHIIKYKSKYMLIFQTGGGRGMGDSTDIYHTADLSCKGAHTQL